MYIYSLHIVDMGQTLELNESITGRKKNKEIKPDKIEIL